jgi:hypothetical protein
MAGNCFVLFIAVGRGTLCLDRAGRRNQDSFQDHLRHIRSTWRGWRIVLLLNRGSPHTAKRSRALTKGALDRAAGPSDDMPGVQPDAGPPGARSRGRSWPGSCASRRVVRQGPWRQIKGQILADEPTPKLGASLAWALEHLKAKTGEQRRQTAGLLSEKFWRPT